MTRCWHSIVQREVPEQPDELTFQPLRNGGEGIRLFARTLPLMHFSSLIACLPVIRMTFTEVESFLRAYEDFFEAHESLEGFAHPGPLPLPLIQLQHAYNDVVALLELTPDANGHLQEAPPALPFI